MPSFPARGLVLVSVAACVRVRTDGEETADAGRTDHQRADLGQLPKPGDERYFVLFFGSQDMLRRPQYTHTWATLVRVRASDAGPGGTVACGCVDPALDVQTISWLPV